MEMYTSDMCFIKFPTMPLASSSEYPANNIYFFRSCRLIHHLMVDAAEEDMVYRWEFQANQWAVAVG
jgi:hypothetical protein